MLSKIRVLRNRPVTFLTATSAVCATVNDGVSLAFGPTIQYSQCHALKYLPTDGEDWNPYNSVYNTRYRYLQHF